MTSYDLDQAIALYKAGSKWHEAAEAVGAPSGEAVRAAYKRRKGNGTLPDYNDPAPAVDGYQPRAAGTLTVDDIGRITSEEDLLRFFKVDPERWEAAKLHISKSEQGQKGPDGEPRIIPLYHVNADLVRNLEDYEAELERLHDEMLADMAEHAPHYDPIPRADLFADDGDPVVVILNLYDPHLGMLAWGKETGEDYDLNIASGDYLETAQHLLALARIYPVAKIVVVVGHDLLHADMPGANNSGGATARGTPQDMDTRLAKAFTIARRSVVQVIDWAREIAPTRVQVVPGNHDRNSNYHLGEVLHAWYRNADDVEVAYGPKLRSFWGWGDNAFMFVHGEEYKRQRGNLPTIFAVECPPDVWVRSTHREVLTGHWHKRMGGHYDPTADLDEELAIITRALPGLTASDAWHVESGYRHDRAGTLIAYRWSGGVAGLHEYTPRRKTDV